MEDNKKDDHINLRVCDSENNEVFFKIKRSTELRKLMAAFAEKQGKDLHMFRFKANGKPVRPENTPEQLNLENEDTIEAFIQAVGGF